MSATSPEAIARKNARRYQRLRLERGTKTTRAAYARLPTDPTEREAFLAARARAKHMAVPFIACDGEGIGRNGEEKYVLLRIGDRELYRGGRRLTTPELLTFILQSPPPERAHLTAFAFEYDIANILRDVPMYRERHDVPSRMERILHFDTPAIIGGTSKAYGNPWTWLSFDGYPEIGIDYLPRHHLRVCYCDVWHDRKGVARRRSRYGSIRTIEDAFAFFQTSFLRAINQWNIGEEHWRVIKQMKARRARFDVITDAIRRYNDLECQLHAQLMAALREATYDAGIRLTKWDGAGRIATVMLKAGGVSRRRDIESKLPAGLLDMAHAAYYGGRFEVTRIGVIDEPVTECDINSAYPAALQSAPCHRHGKWRRVDAAMLRYLLGKPSALFVAPVEFSHPRDAFLCGLPFRQPTGALMWPRAGRGTYWSPELRSAMRLGARVTFNQGPGWAYERKCDCTPYGFLKAAYDARKALGKASRGIPLKLGINATYGKLAQRIGAAPWQNPVDAGLCTAITRAALNAAIVKAGPQNVIMLATDGLYAVGQGEAGPSLDYGAGLGQWEMKRHTRLFIVKPGLYWPPKTKGWQLKTRGLPVKFFEPAVPKFVVAWKEYFKLTKRTAVADTFVMAPRPPVVPIKMTMFVGLRLAFHRKAFDDVCRWLTVPKLISFDWHEKRALPRLHRQSFILDAKPGDAQALSLCYSRAVIPEGLTEAPDWKQDELQIEAMPDYVDLSPPHR